MSLIYDQYITEHKENVLNAFNWLQKHIPSIFEDINDNIDEELKAAVEYQCTYSHDQSKYDTDEYDAYDRYFYGNRSFEVVEDFNYAWLHHIHNNPHHWQYWILHNDDPENGVKVLEMPDKYIIEMICDWWSFSWKQGNLFEIFEWYDQRREYIMLHENTREKVNNILSLMKAALEEEYEK